MVISAGILMYKTSPELQVFLVHPGGPLYAKKDLGYWSIPKGLVEDQDKDLKQTAIREFQEETGIEIKDDSKLIHLDYITQKSGKRVYCWDYEFDFKGKIKSNIVDNPKLGKFPEVDKGDYFDITTAKTKILLSQAELIDKLLSILSNK